MPTDLAHRRRIGPLRGLPALALLRRRIGPLRGLPALALLRRRIRPLAGGLLRLRALRRRGIGPLAGGLLLLRLRARLTRRRRLLRLLIGPTRFDRRLCQLIGGGLGPG